jgi:hypothetical protein
VLHQLKSRLTYANVTATLALFIALGGSSYAAFTLPHNSVGSKQLRTGAVASRQVHDRSIRLRDISGSARRALRGQRGATGATGATGPAGAPAVRYFATMSAAGGLLRGNATSGGHEAAIGSYTVGFGQSVSACSFSATLGTTDASTAPPGRITVNDQGGRVGVQTFDAAGSPADLPFHLVVAC